MGEFVEDAVRTLCEWKRIEVLELNVQPDHVHAVLQIPPKLSVSEVMGTLKGKTGTEEEAVLGKPLLGEGILCDNDRHG